MNERIKFVQTLLSLLQLMSSRLDSAPLALSPKRSSILDVDNFC
jgi:hypothetical protein